MAFSWISVKLMLICVFIYILQVIYPDITSTFALSRNVALSQPWTFLTHAFLHGSSGHLLYNMFALLLFGLILEKGIGSKNFLKIYLLGIFVSAFGSLLFYESSIGASGAIFAIIGVLTILMPRMTVWVFNVPMSIFAAGVIWAVLALIGTFIPADNVAHAAHLFGLFFGFGVGILLRERYGVKTEKRSRSEMSEKEIGEWEKEYMK